MMNIQPQKSDRKSPNPNQTDCILGKFHPQLPVLESRGYYSMACCLKLCNMHTGNSYGESSPRLRPALRTVANFFSNRLTTVGSCK